MSNILIFGDSIAYGYYDSEGGWVDRLKKELLNFSVDNGLEFDLKIYNLAISGDTTEEVLKRIGVELEARNWEEQPTKIIFAIGINDSVLINGLNTTPKDKFENNLQGLIKKAKTNTDFVAFVGLTPVDESHTNPIPWDAAMKMKNKEILNYDKMIREVCKKETVHYIELFNDREEFLEFTKHLHDGLHPNIKGHEILYDKIRSYLSDKL